MDLGEVFGLFSRRHAAPKAIPKLTDEFRNRVLMRFNDTVVASDFTFWVHTHKRLTYLTGRIRLADEANVTDDLSMFLRTCVDRHFLDFIEAALQTEQARWRLGVDPQPIIGDINTFFDVDSLPYALTRYVWQETKAGRTTSYLLLALPQVILKESETTHTATIAPALSLLADPRLKSANEEFLAALQDYRKADYGDCVAKCGSAFESALKAICHVNGWPYAQKDTAAPLLRTVIDKSGLDPFFEHPLMLIATMRNRISTAHGAGTATKNVAKHVAEYAVSATAAGIRLLVQECI